MSMRPPNTPAPRPHPSQPDEPWVNLMFFGTIVAIIVSISFVIAPVMLLALLVFTVVRLTEIKWWWVALAATAAFLALQLLGHAPLDAVGHGLRRANRIAQNKGLSEAVGRIWENKAKWWLPMLPAVPIGALVGALASTLLDSRYPIFETREEVLKGKERRVSRENAETRISKAPDEVKGLGVLGTFSFGDLSKPWVQRRRNGRYICLHPTVLGRHVVVVGKPGSGKTTTLLRLAYVASRIYGWRVYFLDGKGDGATMRKFTALMLGAGVPPEEIAAFPVQPFDGWRTSGGTDQAYAQLLNRLMGTVSFSEPYYRDMTRLHLSKALRLGELPRSSNELLERLERLTAAAPNELKQEARTSYARYASLFDAFPGQLDAGWSFPDCRAGYVLLKGVGHREEAQNLASYLFECFKQYATEGKPGRERVLLIVDEFPALMRDSDAAGMIEKLRSFGCGVAVSGQSYEGLGSDRARIVEAAGTIILHRLSDSDDLAKLAGTVQDFAVTTQVDFNNGTTGRGTLTPEHRFKVEPNEVGRQRDGEVTIIADRAAGHGFVKRTSPELHLEEADRRLTQLRLETESVRLIEQPTEDPSPPDVMELR